MIKIIQNKKKKGEGNVKSQFVPDRLDRIPKPGLIIAIRLSVKSQFVPDRLDRIPKPGLITQLRFD
jgi:hypothetical protein